MADKMIRCSEETHAMLEQIRATMKERAKNNPLTSPYADSYDSMGIGTIIALIGMEWQEKNPRPVQRASPKKG